ncbi:MAG: shikimate dehydrogenase [Alcanivoracaceae bacterium]|nr:shikimate dehydrogenase [Alcanivoracaceae bacterium]
MKSDKVYQLALFGDPVSHSLSPKIHHNFAQQFDLNIDYQLFKVSTDEFHHAVINFFSSGGHGANVTLPHKQQALNISNNISKVAQQALAVNTLFLNDTSEIYADNTDGIGFINDLNNRCHLNCKDKKILMLGAGGATQGIVPEIILQSPNMLVIANRSIEKAKQIAQYGNSQAVRLSELEKIEDKFDLIIHASSLGHQGQTLKFFQHQTKTNTICYDLSYGEAANAFIEYSQSMLINQTYDGLGMLIEQAACSFEVWFGLKPDTQSLTKSLIVKSYK